MCFEAGDKPFQVIDIKVGAPRAGEVRLRVLASALSRESVATVDTCARFPMILGHGGATAVVHDVGAGVTGFVSGDLVIPGHTPECQEWDCTFC